MITVCTICSTLISPGEPVHEDQDPWRLLLLCVWSAHIQTKPCQYYSQNGAGDDSSHQVRFWLSEELWYWLDRVEGWERWPVWILTWGLGFIRAMFSAVLLVLRNGSMMCGVMTWPLPTTWSRLACQGKLTKSVWCGGRYPAVLGLIVMNVSDMSTLQRQHFYSLTASSK